MASSPRIAFICENMLQVCPEAVLLQIVNPMAINTWAIAKKHPQIRQVGLCHLGQGTAAELAHDLDIPLEDIRYRAAGINHMAFDLLHHLTAHCLCFRGALPGG